MNKQQKNERIKQIKQEKTTYTIMMISGVLFICSIIGILLGFILVYIARKNLNKLKIEELGLKK